MFKKIRIAALLFVLFIVAMQTWRSQAQAVAWEHSLHAVVFPINGDGSDASARHIAGLSAAHFGDVNEFFASQAQRYGVRLKYDQTPLRIALAPEVKSLPPAPPDNGNMLQVVMWSLKLRHWAWKHGKTEGMPAQIRVFVIYHDPAARPMLAHSIGLQKGLIGVVHAFAATEMDAQNHVVVAHEILHTLGATDKYDPANNLPVFPDGYADPQKQPRYPQAAAEIMGGRIPMSATAAEIPESLRLTLVGEQTAREIGWRE
jgi:hypothetical protein